MPWDRLCALIEPHYATGQGGRPPVPLERMLRIHCLQQWYDLSAPMMEEWIYDRNSFQRFLSIDLLADKKRDPEMTSTKKGDQWYFGMKAHIGTQVRGKPLIHSVETSTAKAHDKTKKDDLMHGDEQVECGDKGYADDKDKRAAREKGVFYAVLDKAKRSKKLSGKQKRRNKKISRVRAKVEHPFQILKCQWGYRKVRYRGLKKNDGQIVMLCALANIFMVRRSLPATP